MVIIDFNNRNGLVKAYTAILDVRAGGQKPRVATSLNAGITSRLFVKQRFIDDI